MNGQALTITPEPWSMAFEPRSINHDVPSMTLHALNVAFDVPSIEGQARSLNPQPFRIAGSVLGILDLLTRSAGMPAYRTQGCVRSCRSESNF